MPGLALLWFLLWLVLFALPLTLAVYLIWRQTGVFWVLGWLIILLLAYRHIHWTRSWYVNRGGEQVQEFKLNHPTPASIRWMEASNRLILVPNEQVTTLPYSVENDHVLVIDLETRTSHWQPKTEIDLEQTTSIQYLRYVPNLEAKTEFSFVGFSLPFLVYQFSWPFGETRGWQWEKTYFGWEYLSIRETKSSSVVEINRLILNSSRFYSGSISGWVMDSKFFVYSTLR